MKRAAADWAVSVLGDQQVATCDDASCGSADGMAGKGIVTGLGLQPKYEASVTEVETAMVALVAIPPANHLPLPVLERALLDRQVLTELSGPSLSQLNVDVGVSTGDEELVGA